MPASSAVASEQFDIDDFGRVINVIIDPDAELLFEVFDCVRSDAVSPVVDIDDIAIATLAMNKGSEDRITFIFDCIPPDEMAKLQQQGNKAVFN